MAEERRLAYLAALGYFGLTFVYLWPVLAHPTTSYPGYRGDPEQYMWYLGLVWHALTHHQNLFITHLMNYPRGMNLLWNTSILAESFLFGPLFRLAGAAVAYNVWFGLNLFLAGCLGRAILRRLGVRPWLAAAGGALFLFMPYTTAQNLSHISLTTTAPVLVGLLLALDAARPIRRPILFGLAFGGLVVLQFYTLLEVLVTASLVALFLAASAWLFERRRLLAYLGAIPPVTYLTAAAVVLLGTAPGLLVLFFGPYRLSSVVQPFNVYVTDLWNFVLPTTVYHFHLPVAYEYVFTGNIAEDDGYLGLPALLGMVFVLRRLRRTPFVRVVLPVLAAVALLSLGSHLHFGGTLTPIWLPWAALQRVPFLGNVLPARLAFYVDVGVILSLLVLLEQELRTRTGRLPSLAAMGFLLLVFLSWFPAFPYPHTNLPFWGQALGANRPVARAIGAEPTFVLTPAFLESMQALASGGYRFPVANVYGHNDNSTLRTAALLGMQRLLDPDLTPYAVSLILREELPLLHVRRLLFFPEPYYARGMLPPSVAANISQVLGPPLAVDEGLIVWDVPSSRSQAESERNFAAIPGK